MFSLKKIRELATVRPQVIREGRTFRVSALELSAGDRVLLEEGDRVPREGELASGFPLKLEEPGENPGVLEVTPHHAELSPHSKIVSGKGVMVIHQGPQKGGKVQPLPGIGVPPRRHEDFLKKTKETLRDVFWVTVLLDFIFLVFFVWLKKDWWDGIQFGASVFISLVPLEVPLLMKVMELRVAKRFFDWGLGVRDLAAVETLGRISQVLSGASFAESFQRERIDGVQNTVFTPFSADGAQSILASLCGPGKGRVITKNELELMEDGALSRELDQCVVFSGINSDQKLRIAKILMKKGERVAIVGSERDEVRIMERVHLGIALGYTGADVLRESADLVLLRDDSKAWGKAICESRVFGFKVRVLLEYLIPLRIGLVGISLLSLILGLPLILLPAHLAVILLLMGPLSVLAILGGAESRGTQTSTDLARVFDQRWWRACLVRSGWVLLGLAIVGFSAWYLGKGEWDTRSLILFTWVMANAGWVFRTSVRIRGVSGPGAWASGFGVVLYLLMVTVPFIRTGLRVNPLHPLDLAVCGLVGWVVSGLNKKS